MTQSKRVFLAVFVLLILVVTPVAGQAARQRFQWVIAQRLTVTTAGIVVTAGDVAVVEDVTAANVDAVGLVSAADVTASDDVTVADDLTVAGNVIYTLAARQVITHNGVLAPVTASVPISSAAAAGLTVTCAAGGIYHIYNVGAQNILITDTATMKLTANMTLGALDSVTLLGDGTNCVELARANN